MQLIFKSSYASIARFCVYAENVCLGAGKQTNGVSMEPVLVGGGGLDSSKRKAAPVSSNLALEWWNYAVAFVVLQKNGMVDEPENQHSCDQAELSFSVHRCFPEQSRGTMMPIALRGQGHLPAQAKGVDGSIPVDHPLSCGDGTRRLCACTWSC